MFHKFKKKVFKIRPFLMAEVFFFKIVDLITKFKDQFSIFCSGIFETASHLYIKKTCQERSSVRSQFRDTLLDQ